MTASSAPAQHLAAADQALAAWHHSPHALLQVLRETQASAGWLPTPVLMHIAQSLAIPLSQVRGVASFYRFLHLEPAGRTRILFSDNITDRMLGNAALLRQLCDRLDVPGPGGVSTDGRFGIDFASCTGLCDQGPALLVNHRTVITRLTPERVHALAERLLADDEPGQWPAEWSRVDETVHRADVLLGRPVDSAALMRALTERPPAHWMDELQRSGLRGRGGAGFPAARKWTLCRDTAGLDRCVVCNADEGEPGTFKDRLLLRRHAHLMLDGMTVAARTVGASVGMIYLRGEYDFLLPELQAAINQRRKSGWLGQQIGRRWQASPENVFDFDVQIHLGAGAYVCGEESALLESLEGKRGTPRIRPPYPVQSGYLGMPTIVNNVETFCAAAQIAAHGGEAWARIGTDASTGTKLHSISGDCARPGIYEYPFGTSIRTMLQDCGAKSAKAVQVGGPSGRCIGADEFDRTIAFEDLPSAGAFMVFDQTRDLFEVARHFAHFFAHESCGLCTPCRVGTRLVVRRMDKLAQETQGASRGSADDIARLQELSDLLHAGTHCGLGVSSCNPLRDTLKHFGHDYALHVQAPRFEPDFDLDAELSMARQATGRDDPLAHLSNQDERP
ncbi:NAD(P)H-dependent oxidoreductase subunit E [Hydrogenophaga sp. 5NK40-0174]|uniref:NAD(P)H-dependent oxidoreductase subunit E n=1 Tax=Hydrogenophaga sp. 5NK40-0174 TaxID=3127649 RepID=UPI003106E805